MENRIPEETKRPGVCYATCDEGMELPVVDITHPAFACNISPLEIDRIAEKSVRKLQHSAALTKDDILSLANDSILVRKTLAGAGSPMDWMTTYLFKLGPENLGEGYANPIDRKLAAAISPLAIRLRLREVARLLAAHLGTMLSVDREKPLHLLNLASGSAVDSLNALIVINRENPSWLAKRRIYIHGLDNEPSGPRFGSRALDSLLADGAPLYGLDAHFLSADYDWTKRTNWRKLISGPSPILSVLGISSEGGLFEYGSDQEILKNLRSLHCIPGDFPVIGSLVRGEELARTIKEISQLPLRLFSLRAFNALVSPVGWHVTEAIPGNPIYHVVCLKKHLTRY